MKGWLFNLYNKITTILYSVINKFLIKSNPQRQLKTVDIGWNITLHICKKIQMCLTVDAINM